MEGDEAEYSTPQSSVVSSVVVVDSRKKVEGQGGSKRNPVPGTSEESGSRGSSLQTIVDAGLEDQESVTWGLEQSLLCGLAKGP